MKDLVIVLDAAHGEDTPGKRSPDGKFREYKWSRDMIIDLSDILSELGYKVEYTNKSDKEIGLSNRATIANRVEGKKRILISIHSNAAGNGIEWKSARGFSVYTTKGVTKSDKVAEELMVQFKAGFPELKARTDISDNDMDIEENFTVIYKAAYPAVLIEWLFQDNKEDVELLLNEGYNARFVDAIVKAIVNIDKNKLV